MSEQEDEALLELLRALKSRAYRFITPTPATHARVIARRGQAEDLRDVLGWSLPFTRSAIKSEIFDLLERGGVLEARGAAFACRIRVSNLDDALFIHSAFPTLEKDAVFFGPDSYRFAAFVRTHLRVTPPGLRAVDIGTGTGVGAMIAAQMIGEPATGVDINPLALRYAAINFRAAGSRAVAHQGSGLRGIADPIDCVIANPPYIADPARRAYRDGGGMFGAEVALHWAHEAAARLTRGGQFLLYTGSAVVDGAHVLEAPLRDALAGFDVRYFELDPDVFGEELEREDYANVERIAVVGVVAVKR